MNKQKLTVGFGAILPQGVTAVIALLLLNWVATPVFAGSGPAKGTGTGSGSFIGTPVNVPTTPGSNPSFDRSGNIITPSVIQVRVNNIAGVIISRSATINSPLNILNIIITILRGGTSASTPAIRVQTALINARVSPTLAEALVKSLTGMFGAKVGATSSLSVASNKGLLVSQIAQSEEIPDVSISQLNDSINAYNQIILESSPETLRELAQNQEFVAIGNVLKELRQALKK
jgi:hypothetical protein